MPTRLAPKLAEAGAQELRIARNQRALQTLRRALDLGWQVPGELELNPNFAALRELPDWAEVTANPHH